MTAIKIAEEAAMRGIFAPGAIETIISYLVTKTINVSTFKRFERGYAHGVSEKDGGYQEMLFTMITSLRDEDTFDSYCKRVGIKDCDGFFEMVGHMTSQDTDAHKYDLNIFRHMMESTTHHYITSYKWSEKLPINEIAWLYLIMVLDIIDTSVVTNFGDGYDLIYRLLPSGAQITASYGSRIHDAMQCSYTYALHRLCTKIFLNIVELRKEFPLTNEEFVSFSVTWLAFCQGSVCETYSDDELYFYFKEALVWMCLLNRNSYYAENFAITMKTAEREVEEIPFLKKRVAFMKKYIKKMPKSLVPDFWSKTLKEKYCRSVLGSYTHLSYKDNLKLNFPILTTIKDGKFDKLGSQFLKAYFVAVFDDKHGCYTVIPVRGPLDMYPKLFLPRKDFCGTPEKRILQLRQYAYRTFLWEAYDRFKQIHDHCIDVYFKGKEPKLSEDMMLRFQKMGLKVSDLEGEFPSRQKCLDFFRFKVNKKPEIFTFYDKAIATPYRTKIGVWDLILDNNLTCIGIDRLSERLRKGFYISPEVIPGQEKWFAAIKDPLFREKSLTR